MERSNASPRRQQEQRHSRYNRSGDDGAFGSSSDLESTLLDGYSDQDTVDGAMHSKSAGQHAARGWAAAAGCDDDQRGRFVRGYPNNRNLSASQRNEEDSMSSTDHDDEEYRSTKMSAPADDSAHSRMARGTGRPPLGMPPRSQPVSAGIFPGSNDMTMARTMTILPGAFSPHSLASVPSDWNLLSSSQSLAELGFVARNTGDSDDDDDDE